MALFKLTPSCFDGPERLSGVLETTALYVHIHCILNAIWKETTNSQSC